MKLTYCSFAIDDNPDNTIVVILRGHYLDQVDAALAWGRFMVSSGVPVTEGELLSWKILDEFVDLYAPHVERVIPAAEARELFGAKTLGEWNADEQKKSLN